MPGQSVLFSPDVFYHLATDRPLVSDSPSPGFKKLSPGIGTKGSIRLDKNAAQAIRQLLNEAEAENDTGYDTDAKYDEEDSDGVYSTTGASSYYIFRRQVFLSKSRSSSPMLTPLRRVKAFDTELINFSNEARQIGRSVESLWAVHHLRRHLERILFVTRKNASHIFPVLRAPARSFSASVAPRLNKESSVGEEDDFQKALSDFSHALQIFFDRMNEYREFPDHSIRDDITLLINDLKYWIDTLKKYDKRLDSPDVRRFVHAIAVEMGGHIADVTTALAFYINTGMPAIRSEQKRNTKNFLTISTVATFFSAVAATTLQITYSLDQTDVALANLFWFASLVFSIGAALNSLLGLAWVQTIYGSRRHFLFSWVSVYIQGSPLLFLIVAIICFSTGVVLLVYNSDQSNATKIVTVASTIITTLGLTGAAASFAYERWFIYLPGLKGSLSRALVDAEATESSSDTSVTSSSQESFTPSIDEPSPSRKPQNGFMKQLGKKMRRVSTKISITPSVGGGDPEKALGDGVGPGQGLPSSDRPISPEIMADRVLSIRRWQRAIGAVMASNIIARPSPSPHISHARERSHRILFGPYNRFNQQDEAGVTSEQLKTFEITRNVYTHEKEIVHLQFSKDGDRLAVASWGEGASIFRVGTSDPPTRFSNRGILVDQVAWSTNGKMIAIRAQTVGTQQSAAQYYIEIITVDTERVNSYLRPHAVEYICWAADDKAILFIERSNVIKMNIDGQEIGKYPFGAIKLRSLTIIPSSTRLLIVGRSIITPPTPIEPRRSRLEKQLIVYNYDTREMEDTVPLLDDVRHVELSQTGRDVLIGCKGRSPPQLWRLQPVLAFGKELFKAKLGLRHVYKAHQLDDFAGTGHFAGDSDQLVFTVTTAGDILLWERERSTLMHTIRTSGISADLTCISWNAQAINPFMFASGSSDGTIRIWTNQKETGEVIIGDEEDELSWEDDGGPVLRAPDVDVQPASPVKDNIPVQRFEGVAESANISLTHWKIPLPEGFSRPVNEAKSFTAFDSIKIQDLDALSAAIPRMPDILLDHDVRHEDWVRLMQDISHSWAGRGTPSILGSTIQARIDVVVTFLNLWNASFFFHRGLELLLRNAAADGVFNTDISPPEPASTMTNYFPQTTAENATPGPSQLAVPNQGRRLNPFQENTALQSNNKESCYELYLKCIPRPEAWALETASIGGNLGQQQRTLSRQRSNISSRREGRFDRPGRPVTWAGSEGLTTPSRSIPLPS